eukprot:CAMPEP_0196667598 /NCGR_PEP_ID=MMETSP1086-20130531/65170_1 /TAXON_ID=77921 /ORGANISM="Cyanoptyche  gloeocystis , Strain SAG4.97" /LENGTH=221 /DNA_ID=CAMNT_0042004945 /DNA_START=95 /DNA_END=760 /DNA_ORIENTATION=+
MDIGQKVAACVPYAKKTQKLDWILAELLKVIPGKNSYLVNDLFPENRNQSTWTVPGDKVVAFPDKDPIFIAGDKVLSLWQLPDGEWSSMFYEGTVVETPKVLGADIRIRFRGDDLITSIKAEKVVKLPRSSKRLLLPVPVYEKPQQQQNPSSRGKRKQSILSIKEPTLPPDEDVKPVSSPSRSSSSSSPHSPVEKVTVMSVLDKKRMKTQQMLTVTAIEAK